MDLSNLYANAVRNLLIQRVIAGSRIKVIGFGGAIPVASNNIEAGRQKNRRVEIKIGPQTQ